MGVFLPDLTGSAETPLAEWSKPSGVIRDLVFLLELEKRPIVSQRELARRFQVALGAANACLKRMIDKGWIEVRELNRRRAGYYITSLGQSEKSRLTLGLLSRSLQYYAAIKELIGRQLRAMEKAGVNRLVLYGTGNEMEIAYVCLQGLSLRLVGIIDDEDRLQQRELFGFEVKGPGALKHMNPDAILVTCLERQDEEGRRVAGWADPQLIQVWML